MRSPMLRSAGWRSCTAAERATILGSWNATAQPLAPATVPQLFAAQVARTPDATAVVFEGERLSYRELDARANQLAHLLRGLGVGPEVVVALCVERSPALLIGLLGILKAGGAYLPLDPDYPPARLAFMLEDAAAAVLVTQSALLARLPPHGARVVQLDGEDEARRIARQPAQRAGRGARPAEHRLPHLHLGLDRNAEGRAGRHQGLANELLSLARAFCGRAAFSISAADHFCRFDASYREILLPLVRGAPRW